jgi:hypothetical protein
MAFRNKTHTCTYPYQCKFSISTKNFSYPTVNAAEDWLNGKPPGPEGWAEAPGVPEFAPNVNTPEGLLFVKLKFVELLPNWKTEPMRVKAEILH